MKPPYTSPRLKGVLYALCWLPFLLVSPSKLRAGVSIKIEGIKDPLKEQVELYIGKPEVVSQTDLERAITHIESQTQKALQALGYYRPEIDIKSRPDGDNWTIKATIIPGEPVTVAELNIQLDGDAQHDKAFSKLLAELPLEVGSALNHGQYESIKSSFQNLAMAHGYFDARFLTTNVTVYPEQHSAHIRLHFDSGIRYRLGEVTFSQTPLHDRLVRRWMNFSPGTPYDASLIGELHRKLTASNYFSRVRVQPKRNKAKDYTIPVDVQLTAAKSHQLGFGVGFATDTGPRVTMSWERPYLNAQGHSISAETALSFVQQNLSTQYKIPLESNPETDFLTLDAGIQHEDVEDIQSTLYTASIQRQKLTKNHWKQNLFVRWLREDFRTSEGDRNTTLYLPGFSYNLVRSSGGLSPQKGHRYGFEFQFADDALASNIDLQYATFNTKRIHSLAAKHRLLWRFSAGILHTSDFDRTPTSLRFYAGGDSSVRGFAYKSISPEDATGEKIGGLYRLIGSLEYDYRFAEKWRGAIFSDIGDAFNDDQSDPKHSLGMGIRWLSPVGPLRIDLAAGVSETDTPVRLHLSIGPEL